MMEEQNKRSSRELETDSFVENERKKVKNGLLTDDNNVQELDYILKSVRGLLAVIVEIWGSCKEQAAISATLPKPSDRTKSNIKMKREIYEKVKVVKEYGKIIISSEKKLEVHDFGRPPPIPHNLTDLISYHPNDEDILPDYDSYLSKSTILCDEVLLPFLIELRKHLQDVQVFLGTIEAWLLKPSIQEIFLNELFDIDIEKVRTVDGIHYNARISKSTKNKNALCIRCFKTLSNHNMGGRRHIHICGDYARASFHDPLSKVLYSRHCLMFDDGGKINVEFNLSFDESKDKLKALFQYLKMYHGESYTVLVPKRKPPDESDSSSDFSSSSSSDSDSSSGSSSDSSSDSD